MATVNVEFGPAMGAGAPVASGNPRTSETITSSASNQTTTAAAKGGEFCDHRNRWAGLCPVWRQPGRNR